MASTSGACHQNTGFAGAATRPGQTGRRLFPNGLSSLENRHNTGHFRVMETAIFPGKRIGDPSLHDRLVDSGQH